MEKMGFLSLVAVMCCAHLAYGAIHSHQYIYTATSGIPNFPEFTAVGLVNGYQISYFDSDMKKMIPRQEWVPGAVDADFWKRNGENLVGQHQLYANNIVVVKERFNQTGGVHTVMRMYGCQWDDETQAVDGYDQWGYDGEDFVAFDLKNLRIIATTPQSLITKHKLDNDVGLMQSQKHYYTQTCIEWLKKYVQYGSSTLGRKVDPEASLVQKGPKVACHATGFYPDSAMITWKKDGVEMEDDVDVGETLPNEDGTFQKRAVLTISPEEKKATYSCEVTHKSRAEPIVMVFEESGEGSNLPVIIGCVVAVAVLVGVVVAVVMMKKKDYTKASQSDTSSDNSAEPTKA